MKKNKILFIIFIILLFIFCIGIIVIAMPSFKRIDYKESIGIDKNTIGVNYQFNNVKLDNYPIVKENEIYLPIDLVKDYIDKYIYWDENEDTITITNEEKVIRMKTEQLEYYINDEPIELNFPVYNIDKVAYLPKSFLEELYSINIDYIDKTKMMNIENKAYKMAYVKRSTNLRQEGNRKAPIIQNIKRKEMVYFNELGDKYTKICTEKGYTGYVKTKLLKDIIDVGVERKYDNDYEAKSPWKPEDGKINLVFDQVQKVESNSSSFRRTAIDGVDVLVPTWFSFKDKSGKIINIADKSYVDFAHKNGDKVWGLITDNFDSEISHAILSSTKTREYVIKQLLAFVSTYDLDGINIDFESVLAKDSDNYIQFLRELSPALRMQGAVLSVDLFVPKPWTEHYNRKEVGKIVDYVVVMGYDEHYSGSENAGSVASLDWSEIAIKDTLTQDVPKEKLILGIPFYTRMWTIITENGEEKLYSKAMGMQEAYDFIIEKDGKFVYDEETGQNYGEATSGNRFYRVWLEDTQSVEKRLELVNKYDIAGVGAWKRGFETEEVWHIIKEKMKG